jgi:hypothetical protein
MPSPQQIAQCHRDGFIVAPGVVDPATIDALRTATQRIVDGAAHVDQHADGCFRGAVGAPAAIDP